MKLLHLLSNEIMFWQNSWPEQEILANIAIFLCAHESEYSGILVNSFNKSKNQQVMFI